MILTDIHNPFESAPIYYKERTGSTMNDIKELQDSGHGAVIFTGYQESGRGRLAGRPWISGQDQNLLFSLQLDTDKLAHPPFQIPLLSGLGIAEFLEERYGLKASIKWPNDVLIDGKKISGILCESNKDRIYVGIGLNCTQRFFEEAFRHKSTSISLLSDEDCTPRLILSSLLQNLKECYFLSSWRERIFSRLHGRDQVVYLAEGLPDKGTSLPVQIKGLSDEGFLIVKDIQSGIIKTVLAGELLFPGYHIN